jgi:hypothetical protein
MISRTAHFLSGVRGCFRPRRGAVLSCLCLLKYRGRDALATGLFIAGITFAHESPVDHVERELRLSVRGGALHLRYRVQQSERSVLMQLHQMDGNGDGLISDTERDSFLTAQAQKLAALFKLEIEGQLLKFVPSSAVRCDARLGQTFTFTAALPTLHSGKHPGRFTDGYSLSYPGPFRWLNAGEGNQQDIRVEPSAKTEKQPSTQHPSALVLNFDVVVPQ